MNVYETSSASNALTSDNAIGDVSPLVAPDLHWEMLPGKFAEFVDSVASRQGSSSSFTAVSLLTAFAGMIGNTVSLCPKAHDDWTVVPTLWSMLVGEPSAMKSPALAAGISPLHTLESKLISKFEAERRSSAATDMLDALKTRETLRRVERAIRAGDDLTALELLECVGPEKQQIAPRLIVHDISLAKIVELLGKHPHGFLMVRDELPQIFSRMTSKAGAEERALFLQLYNGTSSYTYDRAGKPEIRIPTATMSLAGTIQPSRLAPIVKGAVSEHFNDGLLARFQLAVWPDTNSQTLPMDIAPDHAVIEAAQHLFERAYLESRRIEERRVIRFSTGAQRAYDGWAPEFRYSANAATGALRSYLVKWNVPYASSPFFLPWQKTRQRAKSE